VTAEFYAKPLTPRGSVPHPAKPVQIDGDKVSSKLARGRREDHREGGVFVAVGQVAPAYHQGSSLSAELHDHTS
jgi:hypothetical protein